LSGGLQTLGRRGWKSSRIKICIFSPDFAKMCAFFFHVPNGGYRTPIEAKIMKRSVTSLSQHARLLFKTLNL
jgi:hypothetical protein